MINRAVRLCLLAVLLVPVLFVMGTVASSADILAPFPVKAYQDGLGSIARGGEALRAHTEGLVTRQIDIILKVVRSLEGPAEIFRKAEGLQRIKALAEKSI